MKERLITDDEIKQAHPVLRGKYGDTLVKLARKLSGVDNACDVYDGSKHLTGVNFNTDLLDKLGLERVVVNGHILEEHNNQPFITVSNHPNGHMDGIALIETVASRVNNFKVMVNFILGMIDTMSENFITVSPYKQSNEKMKSISISGIKECFDHIRNGKPLGFFPAGSVSRLKFRGGKFVIHDREWQESVLKIIQKADAPIIPIHIECRNRYAFYASRFIHWTLQSLALCHELKNKKGKKMILTVGEPIPVEEIRKYKDTKELGDFLRAKTYELAKKR